MKGDRYEVKFVVQGPDGDRTYYIKEPGALIAEKVLQLYSLGNVEALELEPTSVSYPACERVRDCTNRETDPDVVVKKKC